MDASPDGGEVPVLVTDDGEALFQSDTIMQYIDEAFGERLVKGSPLDKARDRAWGRLASDNYLTQCATQRSQDETTFTRRLKDLAPIFAAMEERLGAAPYFHGTEVSAVDIDWLPVLHRSELIRQHAGYDFFENYPKLQTWRASLLATSLAERSVPKDFEEIFTSFYLNEETHLGRLVEGCGESFEPGGGNGGKAALATCCGGQAGCGS